MPAERTWMVEEGREGAVSTAPRGPGTRLGPFELVRLLGEGASSDVWQAVDLRTDAPVALKLFRSARGDVLGRVMAEARASSRIASDHVVYVRDAGVVDGVYYIAMALCREETVSDAASIVARSLRDEEPRSLDEVVSWGEQMARGMAAAHAVGVFHRDLKPENVLCLPGSRVVRILDFGLASLTSTARWRPATPTDTLVAISEETGDWTPTVAACSDPLTVPDGEATRLVAGTPAYMAPEQARGFRRPPDPSRDAVALAAIDIYGVGATLWALLAGRTPHVEDGDEPIEQVRARAAAGAPPPLDAVPTRFPVPARLVRIVARAMATDPAERYPSVAALAVDLASFRANRPTSNDAPWSPVRALLFIRRHPGRVAASVWTAALCLGFVASVGLRTELGDTMTALDAARDELASAQEETLAERARVEEEALRADVASGEAFSSARRADTAEEHLQRLRRFAAAASARADKAEADATLAREAAGFAAADAALAQQAREEAERLTTEARRAQASSDADAAVARAGAADAEMRSVVSAEAERVASARAAHAEDVLASATSRLARMERDLEATRAERDALARQLADAQVRGAAAEAELSMVSPPIAEERPGVE
jgi:serine/threonine protein kinase